MNIEEILALDDSHREVVYVKEWATNINVCSMTAAERSDIEKSWSGNKSALNDPGAFRCDILARTLKNDDGTPLGTHDQIRKLLGKNANAVERLFEAACRVSGFRKEDVEELEKN